MVTIENSKLKVEINELGAELFSIQNLSSGRECLWCGNEAYWRSRSPVLFPIVGALYDGVCRIDGVEYEMKQHGVARALPFQVVKSEPSEVLLSLKSSEATKKNYPYEFELKIDYKLCESTLVISYQVVNPSDETIYFQLGAHPGFNFLDFNPDAPVQGYFAFNDVAEQSELTLSKFEAGYLSDEKQTIKLCGQKLPIVKDTFDNDALILEDSQSCDISLMDANGEEYIRVKYDAPVVGLWSKPCGGYAPFTCIEPWYGRCDRAGYTGEFKDKDWMQSLAANQSFTTSVVVEIAK